MPTYTVNSAVYGALNTATQQYQTKDITATLQTVINGMVNFPTGGQSQWVSVDFYFSTSNSTKQPLSGLTPIGDQGVQVTSLALGQSVSVNIANLTNGLFDLARQYTGNPSLLPKGNYYLYAQVRNAAGTVSLGEGCFTTQTFAPMTPS